MEELLNKLYNYENFGIYLVISIAVLVLIFIIILFLGKKDKKEREKTATLKLQQINSDAFKEENIMQPLEVPSINQEKLENDTIIVPNISEVADVMDDHIDEIPEPVLPQVTEELINKTQEILPKEEIVQIEAPMNEPAIETHLENTPLLERVEEKPLIFSEPTSDIVVPKIEAIKEEIPEVVAPLEIEEMEVPTFNFDEIVKDVEEVKKEQTYTKGPEIFSSVYVPKKEEVEAPKEKEEVIVSISDEESFELPTLKKEVVEETLPKEKEEEKIEMPDLTDYNLDSLSGETYTIK